MAFQVPTSFAPKVASNVPSAAISPKGSPAERLWIIAEAPLPKDRDKGYLFSSGMGWSYDKMLGEMGLYRYFATVCPSGNQVAETEFIDLLNRYCPPIIVALDSAAKTLVPQIKRRKDVNLWAGSLLQSDKLNFPHYIIPTFGPETCVRDWTERQVVKFVDYGKIKDELDYFALHKALNPKPEYILETELDNDLPRLVDKLGRWLNPEIKYLSVDVESIYPREKSAFFGHPGYPLTVGIATSPNYGISFELWRESTRETGLLWRVLGELMASKYIIGQNFHSFDAWHFQMLGMPVDRRRICDTMHMHAVLWPELPHKLQFLTRQYTRQPYYKSEGHHWSPKDMQRLKRYNALDTVVTYECFLRMQAEAQERGMEIF